MRSKGCIKRLYECVTLVICREENTWEPKKNLIGCSDMIAEFEANQLAEVKDEPMMVVEENVKKVRKILMRLPFRYEIIWR